MNRNEHYCLNCFSQGRYVKKVGACPVCGDCRGVLATKCEKYEATGLEAIEFRVPEGRDRLVDMTEVVQ